jgi:hypothetical protein
VWPGDRKFRPLDHGLRDLLVGDAAEDNADGPDALVPELRP